MVAEGSIVALRVTGQEVHDLINPHSYILTFVESTTLIECTIVFQSEWDFLKISATIFFY